MMGACSPKEAVTLRPPRTIADLIAATTTGYPVTESAKQKKNGETKPPRHPHRSRPPAIDVCSISQPCRRRGVRKRTPFLCNRSGSQVSRKPSPDSVRHHWLPLILKIDHRAKSLPIPISGTSSIGILGRHQHPGPLSINQYLGKCPGKHWVARLDPSSCPPSLHRLRLLVTPGRASGTGSGRYCVNTGWLPVWLLTDYSVLGGLFSF